MNKFKKISLGGDTYICFYCSGCEESHGFVVVRKGSKGPVWTWDENLESPTFSPSLKITSSWKGKERICHLFLKSGKIQYLADCTHSFAGKTIEPEDLD